MTVIYIVLIAGLAWELVARPLIGLFNPEVELPESVLGEIAKLLLGMLGLAA